MKKIALIIVNYNGREDTIECLESLKKMDTKKNYLMKIFLIDNGSSDDSVAVIKKRFSKIRIIEAGENLGFVGGNNLGLKAALAWSADFTLLLNNDVKISPKLLINLLKPFSKAKVGIVSPKIYFFPRCEYYKEKYQKDDLGKVIWYAGGRIDWQNMYGVHLGVDKVDKGEFEEEKEIDFATGCCLMVKSEVWKQVGLFDEKFFLYGEDLDFCQRVKKYGYKIIYYPKAFLWHKSSGSSGSGSSLHDYYLTRNRMLLGFKYAPLRTKLALIKESLRLLFKGREWEKIAIRDFYMRKFGKGSYKKIKKSR